MKSIYSKWQNPYSLIHFMQDKANKNKIKAQNTNILGKRRKNMLKLF